MITNALSVDVEEHYHADIFRRATRGRTDLPLASRVERNVDRLLALMSAHGAHATWFVVGEVAERHGAMVRRIAAAGHEVGCHSDRHDSVSTMTAGEFRADLRRAKARIEDALGAAIVGYRAPNFSIGPAQSWAYRILLEEGFRYDSSTHPILHDRYGQPDAPRFPYEVCREAGQRLIEFPIGTARALGLNLPIGGGGYFRLAPLAVTCAGLRHVNRVERRPVMFYVHPWELDEGQPRPDMRWAHRFRLYVGIEREEAKLAGLLARFRFGAARDVLAMETAAPRHIGVAAAAAAGAPGL
jgi:polysaccharide deacetylase family protein (PEP-CTERM system associated)